MVMFRDSEDKRLFGIITEILKKNQVMVRCIRHKSATEIAKHQRVLILLYRPLTGTKTSLNEELILAWFLHPFCFSSCQAFYKVREFINKCYSLKKIICCRLTNIEH